VIFTETNQGFKMQTSNVIQKPTLFQVIATFVGIAIVIAALADSFAWASDPRPESKSLQCTVAQQKFWDAPIKKMDPYVPMMQQFFEVCK
jgi:hypothetical protein